MQSDAVVLVKYLMQTSRVTPNGIVTFSRGEADIMPAREAHNLTLTGQVRIVGDAQTCVDSVATIEWSDDADDSISPG